MHSTYFRAFSNGKGQKMESPVASRKNDSTKLTLTQSQDELGQVLSAHFLVLGTFDLELEQKLNTDVLPSIFPDLDLERERNKEK